MAALTVLWGKLGVKDINTNLVTAIRVTVILLFVLGIAFRTGTAGQIRQIHRRTWMFLALSGIATDLSWLFYFHALQLGDASIVAHRTN
ncbi:MAG: EamA family transporter [Victivallales bacterium]|nr:EamA family transporter [Victivallales bacterium]